MNKNFKSTSVISLFFLLVLQINSLFASYQTASDLMYKDINKFVHYSKISSTEIEPGTIAMSYVSESTFFFDLICNDITKTDPADYDELLVKIADSLTSEQINELRELVKRNKKGVEILDVSKSLLIQLEAAKNNKESLYYKDKNLVSKLAHDILTKSDKDPSMEMFIPTEEDLAKYGMAEASKDYKDLTIAVLSVMKPYSVYKMLGTVLAHEVLAKIKD